ncbi:class C beta-lactamase-related serine hydrolase [Leucothrix sargassi]|nr:class C beta-lactamase-related serine hydrolase [Leucothrix sargassi]
MEAILIFLLTFVAIVACGSLFIKTKLNRVVDNKNLEASIAAEVKKMTKGAPKEAIMVGVYKKGTSFLKAEGRFSEDLYQLPDRQSVFQIGSLSKVMTVAVLHALIDEGVVKMDDTLGDLIGDQYDLAVGASTVTLRQLVTHTSGFPRVPQAFIDKTLEHYGKDDIMENPYSVLSFKDVLDYLKTCDGKKAAGNFEYSNFGSGLLGHILEIVTDKDLNTLAREKLFAPLGMNQTSIELSPEMQESMVQGYRRNGNQAELWEFGALAAAGAFSSTVVDMMTFLKAYLQRPDIIKAPLSSDGGWMAPGKIEKLYGNTTAYWHNGQVGGYASYAAVDPENDVAVVVLSAKATDLTMPGIMLTRAARTQSWASQS